MAAAPTGPTAPWASLGARPHRLGGRPVPDRSPLGTGNIQGSSLCESYKCLKLADPRCQLPGGAASTWGTDLPHGDSRAAPQAPRAPAEGCAVDATGCCPRVPADNVLRGRGWPSPGPAVLLRVPGLRAPCSRSALQARGSERLGPGPGAGRSRSPGWRSQRSPSPGAGPLPTVRAFRCRHLDGVPPDGEHRRLGGAGERQDH